jgi:MFS family permease
VRSLHGLRYYGWAFTAFFLANVVGIVDAGRRCDNRGPRASLIGGLVFFALGLTLASVAPVMLLFVAGRALQGLGAGSMIVAVYFVVARAFPSELQARALAALSAAWVLPALVGPVAAGAVAQAFGWRWVFIGIAPLAVLGALLLGPVMSHIPHPDATRSRPPVGPVSGVVLAGGLAVLEAAGDRLDWTGGLLALAGIALAVPPLRRLLPSGALRLARGLPTVIILRGVLTAAFFGAEAYLPLTLTRLHHGTPTLVGIPLTIGALGWSAGSWWQGHRTIKSRQALLMTGFLLVAIAVAALALLADRAVSLWVAAPIWVLAGAGMGLGMPTVAVLTMRLSSADEQGANSAALQLTNVIGSALAIAAGASIINAGPHFALAVITVDTALAAVALSGAIASRRVTDSRT